MATAGQKSLKSHVTIETFIRNLFQESERESPTYQDTKLVCRDGNILSSRLLLSLAFPILGRTMAWMGETIEPVIILPDYSAGELKGAIQTFLSETDSDLMTEFDDQTEMLDYLDMDYTQNTNNGNQVEVKGEVDIKSEVPDENLELLALSSQDLFKCIFCSEAFVTESEKKDHEKSYRNSDGMLKCRFEHCDSFVFKFRRGLVKHIKAVHYTDQDKNFSCYFCGENFIGKVLYRKHLKLYKDGPKDYKCPEEGCVSRFRVKRTLLDHLRKHQGVYEYFCETCGKSCTTRYTLKSHMRSHETSQLICHICSKTFKNKRLLHGHIKLTHADREQKMRYKCDQCEKGYPTKTRLDNHMYSHTGVRNFSCTTCGKKFLNKPNLFNHEKSTHSGEKPYKCNDCGKGFPTSNKMKRHQVIHTGVMEYNCSKCGKKFNQKINKNTHEKKCNEVAQH